MNRLDVRELVIQDLKELNLFRYQENHNYNIERSNELLEPIIKPQWFVNCKELAY